MEALLTETASKGKIRRTAYSAVELVSSIKSSFTSATQSNSETSLGCTLSREQLIKEFSPQYLSSDAECESEKSKAAHTHAAKLLHAPGKLLWMHRAGYGSEARVVARVPPSRDVFTGILLQAGMLTNHFMGRYTKCVRAWKGGD